MHFAQGHPMAGGVRFPSEQTRPEYPRRLLPRGRVEIVRLVDPRLKQEHGSDLRISFDHDSFAYDESGRALPETAWKSRVTHVISVLNVIRGELVRNGVMPVYLGKQDGDEILLALWKTQNAPILIVEVCGWRVECVWLEWGTQCLKGLDPELAEITNLEAWPT